MVSYMSSLTCLCVLYAALAERVISLVTASLSCLCVHVYAVLSDRVISLVVAMVISSVVAMVMLLVVDLLLTTNAMIVTGTSTITAPPNTANK